MLRQFAASSTIKVPFRGLVQIFNGPDHEETSYSRNEKMAILENGIFAVMKPKNLGSTEVVEIIKNVFIPVFPAQLQASLKVGHGGVLDRTASGVLAIGVGRGCQSLPRFLHGKKTYVVTGHLGISTSTYNETGEIINKMPYGHVTEGALITALSKFHGKIMQTPPVYSALKRHGRRYSDLAREGKDVTPAPRLVKCHALKCIDFHPPLFTLVVTCGGGFYIRSLIHDLGIELGCCAHVHELHRTRHGIFKEKEALAKTQWTLEHILDSILRAKKLHADLFKRSPIKHVRSGQSDKHPVENERSIVFTDDVFDL